MIELQLAEYFQDDDAIHDRVGGRIRPGRALQHDRGEIIILQEITNNPEYHLEGEAGIHDRVVQIDCYAETPLSAYELSELVRAKISGFRGIIGQTNPVYVQSCRIISSGQENESPEDGSDKWVHRYRMDIALFVDASIPVFE